MKVPPNMSQVAAAAGVHQSTVSLALRNHGSISQATRERIQQIAREMGYQRNPLVSALIASRRKRTDPRHRHTLAYLTSFPDPTNAAAQRYQARMLRNLQEQAEFLGYSVEPFWLRAPGMTPVRMKQILLTRGIRGIFVCPLLGTHQSLDFDFSEFAAIVLGRALKEPRLDFVEIDHYSIMKLVIAKLWAKGCRRILFAIARDIDQRLDHLYLSAFLHAKSLHPRSFLKPDISAKWNERAAVKRLRTERPDAIIAATLKSYYYFHPLIQQKELGLPDYVALACLACPPDSPEMGGFIRSSSRAAAAVQFVTHRVEHGDFGLPAEPKSILIASQWRDGELTKTAAR